MKHTKILAAALSCALLMTGCSAKTPMSLKTASSKEVMQVGNIGVTEGVYHFLLQQYYSMAGDMDTAKKYTAAECEDNYTVLAVADAMGIKLDSDKQKELDDTKQQVKDSQPDGYNSFLEESGLTDADVDTMLSVAVYTDVLKEQIPEEEVTDESKKEFFKNNYRRAKHILISTMDMTTREQLPEEQQEEAKKKADELLERAQNGEDFDALMNEYSEDPGSAANPDGYVFTDDEMVSEFQDGVDSIGVGEITLVKSDFGYHIIKRLALDETPEYFEQEYEKVADNLESVMQQTSFQRQLKEWKEEYNIEVTTDEDAINEIAERVKKEDEEAKQEAAKELNEAQEAAENEAAESTEDTAPAAEDAAAE